MNSSDLRGFPRRTFLAQTSAIGAAALIGMPRLAAAEPPPEVKKIRLAPPTVTCAAPLRLARELLRLEGFSEVEYVGDNIELGVPSIVAGHADIAQSDTAECLPLLDQGKNLLVLAGLHVGCQELFANESVKGIRDLRGKRIAISQTGSGDHVFISSILAYIGINPTREVTWVVGRNLTDAVNQFIDGKADAFMAFEPQQHELRDKKIGRAILNLGQDRPWSQYFCCMIYANPEFARRHPIATKRALRAILKAADLCAQDPERVARYLVANAHESRYEMTLEILKSLPFNRWREANPEDTLRFLALRLHEVGMIKTSPNELIARGTDWRFLNALKKELKA